MSNTHNVPDTTVPRDIPQIEEVSGNLYESLAIISKRANQIGVQMKEELHAKLAEFATDNDNLEEIFENREQIEIATFYEKLPKPTLIATEEFLNNKVYFRNPAKEDASK
ncbi:MAG: RNA polymerase Rpb6 [Bacteroidetes bacterium]|nr:MAG: RNA polymerase Rpb6 [Bacteroidota bacterium]